MVVVRCRVVHNYNLWTLLTFLNLVLSMLYYLARLYKSASMQQVAPRKHHQTRPPNTHSQKNFSRVTAISSLEAASTKRNPPMLQSLSSAISNTIAEEARRGFHAMSITVSARLPRNPLRDLFACPLYFSSDLRPTEFCISFRSSPSERHVNFYRISLVKKTSNL